MGPRGKGVFPVGWVVHVWRALVFVCSRASDLDRCPLRRRVPQRGARAPPPLNPPLLVCAGAWLRCLVLFCPLLRALCRAGRVAHSRLHPLCSGADSWGARRRASHGATTPQRGRPTRERNHVCNYARACPWRRGECGGTHGIRLGTAVHHSNAPGLASARPCLSSDMLN
jgi:hypothetical protein